MKFFSGLASKGYLSEDMLKSGTANLLNNDAQIGIWPCDFIVCISLESKSLKLSLALEISFILVRPLEI